MKIVIANSVGIDRNGRAIIHSPSRWTNSSPDRNVFTYYPWELAYTSSLLKRETDHTIVFIDGCLEKLDGDAYFERLRAEEPDMLLMEPSTRTWRDDARVMMRLKKVRGTKIMVAGQHATAFPDEVARVADYVLHGEYEYTVLDIVRGVSHGDIQGLYPNPRRPLLDVTKLPWPEDTDVSRVQYGVPGEPSSEYCEVQAYATRGCPMNCTFCVCRHLYYARPNWRPRAVDDVIAELTYLRNKYPQMEGIFFDEECHNIRKPFVLDLTKAIIAHKLHDLHIEAMCTYYTLDEEMMDAMKEAGYYLLRVGIETAGADAARGINLGAKFNLGKLRSVLRYARRIGLKMYGTFTFGAPGASPRDDQATLDFMEEIIGEGLLWRFQTSICTPQPGTPFYEWAEEKGLIKTYTSEDYDGGNRVVIEYPDYSSKEIMAMYGSAQRFYDIALKQRFTSGCAATEKQLAQLPLKKIVLIRSSRMPQIKMALSMLRRAFPQAVIDVLGQPVVQDELEDMQKEYTLGTLHWYTGGFFSADDGEEQLRERLRHEQYDCAFVVYSNMHGRGYENVEALLDAVGITQWKALNSLGHLLNQEDIQKKRSEERNVCPCE